jgi:beta-glucanase (GH16 family)
MFKNRKSLGIMLALITLVAVVPSNAFERYAAKLKAPVITSITAPEHDRIVVKYKIDTLRKKQIRYIKYSTDGKVWTKTFKSPITITGLEGETTYKVRLRQTSKDYRVTNVSRSITTPAQPESEILPELSGFSVGTRIWADEFNSGNTINTGDWTARYCGHSGANGGGTCHNNESQYYIPEAITIEDGNAVITTNRVNSAPPSPATCLGGNCAFTSGRFDTQGKVSFQYGYIETRMKMPQGDGNWAAFWMLGTDIVDVSWPRSGEMDIAEQGGNAPTRNSAALHYADNGGGHLYEYGETFKGFNFYQDFHTYGLAWTPDQMTLFVDRVAFWTINRDGIRSDNWPGNKPYFLILNNAVGPIGGGFGGLWGNWTTSKTYIDYVRVYKLDGYGTVND